LPTKTFKIFENREIKVPPLWSKNGISISKSITWNEKDTTITSAKLRLTIKPSMGYVKAWTELNYNEIGRFSWILGDNSVRSEEFDIIGVLINGSNYFKVIVAKEFGNFFEIVFVVSVTVVITYEGKDPDIKPSWQKYLEYAAYGSAAAAGIVVVGGALKEKKK